MQELVSFIAKSLVDEPDKVKTNLSEENDTIKIELSVDQDDLGKVIGKQGRTARAMRSLLAASVSKNGKKSRLDIIE